MPDWDEIFRTQGHLFREPHSEMPRLLSLFKKNNVRRVLDLGCGTGRHLVYFAGQGIEMYGTDSSLSALALAKEWIDEEGLSANVSEHRMEHDFPFDNGFFDAVISIQVIHHNLMREIRHTIREIHRVLRVGGLVFVSVPVLQTGPIPREIDWHLEEVEDRTYVPQRGPESGIPHHYFTEQSLRSAFLAFDILDVFIDDTGHRCLIGMKRE
ncbi:MAG: class I SAM-dependent methyltransferase [Candidatus Thorarchaeota archaeon]|nr:MAG: hypothetical protein DRP09_11950 [Candidatus Thorarchaeota archaeon]RLI59864.1 MAG: hypothetical protein DRO87_01560 [Candidatus Thorarchaeota archaeon]